MATIGTTAPTSTFVRTAVPRRPTAVSSPAIGLPRLGGRGGRVKCSTEAKPSAGAGASMLAAASVMAVSNPVLALVDDRMSTEGTGLSLGISNNLLGWILVGVFALIWALFFVYTSTLEEDDDSALSL
ncbi:photosystem II reaction center W protein, chloroplastic-like [Musa acuminata AAA Group]|uniref:photosystem II reaction center W protein, chloroplastic-like n=1 Tax=Musa acuminata AAA Group TaxID=214697 RepID=UPI0031D7167B